MKNKILFSSFMVMAIILSACGSATPAINTQTVGQLLPITGLGTDTPMSAGATMPAATAAGSSGTSMPSGPAAVNTGQNSSLGTFLVDSKGMTLYLFTKDTQNSGSSTCIANCAAVWPPLLTEGTPSAGTGVQSSMLGTITRADGSTQVTYNGWPLYYFKNDAAAGDTNGEGVQGVWYVVTPEGNQK